MSEYRAPVKDVLFALRHLGGIDELAKTDRFAHADYDTIASVLDELGRFMNEVFAPTNVIGDREGLVWSPEGVTTPAPFHSAYEKYVAAGWQGLNAQEEYGGAGFPAAIELAKIEFSCAANGALSMCPGLTTGAIECLQRWGSEEVKETFLRKMVTGEWTGTMNITEPQAGSDVGLATTRAVPHDDGTYRITGTKIFISFGEHDLAENIVHLVLARLPDAPQGTRGISLFLVPKILPDGSPNDVRCVSIEHKLGIHASPTCVMSYGDGDGAVGWLIGEENGGMRAMFTMMNNARLNVGLQGVSIAERAMQQAVSFARQRVQGTREGRPARIIEFPDVRRMLLRMKALTQAARALAYYTAGQTDRASLGESAARARADLLTPLVKAYGTDVGVEVTSLALQVHGGMGYVEETGAAQHYRDARISPIYEGTNGIQAADLVGRKLSMEGGEVLARLLSDIRRDASSEPALLELADVCADVSRHLLAASADDRLAGSYPFLTMLSTAVSGWLLAQQLSALDDQNGDSGFAAAKRAAVRYYLDQVVPEAAGLRAAAVASAELLYSLDEEAFAA